MKEIQKNFPFIPQDALREKVGELIKAHIESNIVEGVLQLTPLERSRLIDLGHGELQRQSIESTVAGISTLKAISIREARSSNTIAFIAIVLSIVLPIIFYSFQKKSDRLWQQSEINSLNEVASIASQQNNLLKNLNNQIWLLRRAK